MRNPSDGKSRGDVGWGRGSEGRGSDGEETETERTKGVVGEK